MPLKIRSAFIFFSCLLSCFLTLGGGGAEAQTNTGPSRVYRLGPGSTFQSGCFPPCLCPVMESGTVRGTFRLALTSVGNVFDFYSVRDVRWAVDLPSSPNVHRIVGSGTYQVSLVTSPPMHQMILDLAIDQNLTQHFDSGMVAMSSPFPKIDISVSLNGGTCHDTVITLRARPLSWMNVGPSAVSWEALSGSTGYDVVRGDLTALHASGGNLAASSAQCLANGATTLSLSDTAMPAPGQGFYFIVRDEEGATQETWDEGDTGQIRSRDPGLQNAPGSCP